MNQWTKMGTGIGVLLAIAGGMSYIKVPLSQLSEHQTSLAIEDRREIDIEVGFDAIWRRRETKAQLVDALAAGRMSLFEVASQFQRLIAELPPEWQYRLRQRHGGESDAEFACRAVIGFVKSDLPLDKLSRAELLQRLETEMCNLRHDGAFDDPAGFDAKKSGAQIVQ